MATAAAGHQYLAGRQRPTRVLAQEGIEGRRRSAQLPAIAAFAVALVPGGRLGGGRWGGRSQGRRLRMGRKPARQGRHILIAMAGRHQLRLDRRNPRAQRQLQPGGGSGLQGDLEILVVQRQPETQRESALEHVGGAVPQGPGARRSVDQRLTHLLHRQLQSLTQGEGLGHRPVAACHQHLVHRLHPLACPYRPEVAHA